MNMEEGQKEITLKEEIKSDINNLPNRAIRIAGATASIMIIAIILKSIKLIPNSIALSLGLFVSLPLIYSFIFGIIFNKPNFASALRHYSFAIYIIISLVIYMVILKPDSLILIVRYLLHFFIGFILAIMGYTSYAVSYKLSKKLKKYRWRALISFGVSFLTMFIITFILYYFKIFELI